MKDRPKFRHRLYLVYMAYSEFSLSFQSIFQEMSDSAMQSEVMVTDRY